MNTWVINWGWRQLRGGASPCGCRGAGQVCSYELPDARTGYLECTHCGATWGDYEGDAWMNGDWAPDAPPELACTS